MEEQKSSTSMSFHMYQHRLLRSCTTLVPDRSLPLPDVSTFRFVVLLSCRGFVFAVFLPRVHTDGEERGRAWLYLYPWFNSVGGDLLTTLKLKLEDTFGFGIKLYFTDERSTQIGQAILYINLDANEPKYGTTPTDVNNDHSLYFRVLPNLGQEDLLCSEEEKVVSFP